MFRAAVPDRHRAGSSGQRAASPSFRSNKACDRAFGFLRSCETRPPPGRHVHRPRLSWPPTSRISQRGRWCVSHLFRLYSAHEQVPSAGGLSSGRRPSVRIDPGILERREAQVRCHRDITRRRPPGASMALTPSTTHGGHPVSRGAPVATTMASSVRCSRSISSSSLARRVAGVHRRHQQRAHAQSVMTLAEYETYFSAA
jgi:hypothetical protein